MNSKRINNSPLFNSKEKHNLFDLHKSEDEIRQKLLAVHWKPEILEEIFSKSWAIDSIEHGKMAICAETCNKDSWLNMLYIK